MTTKTGFAASGGKGAFSGMRVNVVSIPYDFTKESYAQNVIAKLWTPDAGTFVLAALLQVETAEGEATTCHIGDFAVANDAAVDADGWLASGDLNAVARTLGAGAYRATNNGKLYDGTAYIGMTVLGAVTHDKGKGKVKFITFEL